MSVDPETAKMIEVGAKSVGSFSVLGLLIWGLKTLRDKKQVSLRWHTVDKNDKPHTTEVTINRS